MPKATEKKKQTKVIALVIGRSTMVTQIDSPLQYEVKKCFAISTHVLKNIVPKESLTNRHHSHCNKLKLVHSLINTI